MDKVRKTRATTPFVARKLSSSPFRADKHMSPNGHQPTSPRNPKNCKVLDAKLSPKVHCDIDVRMVDRPRDVSDELQSLEQRLQSLSGDAAYLPLPLSQSLMLSLAVLVMFLFGTLCKCNLMLYYNAAELTALRHALTEHGVAVGEPRFTAPSNAPSGGSVLFQVMGGVLYVLLHMVAWATKTVVQCVVQLAFSIFVMPLVVYAFLRKGYYMDDFIVLRNMGGTRLLPLVRQFPVAKVVKFLRSDDKLPDISGNDARPTIEISEEDGPVYNLLSSPYAERTPLIELLEMYGENDDAPPVNPGFHPKERGTPAREAQSFDISDSNDAI